MEKLGKTGRRGLLAGGAALLANAAWAKGFAHPIGLNLYTVRTSLAKDAAGTYAALGKIGIRPIEVRPVQLQQHAAMIREAGLQPVHMFVESACITGAWTEWQAFSSAMAARYKMPAPPANAPKPTLDEMIALAKAHKVQRIGTSMLLPEERKTAIPAINQAAEKCLSAGLELYYHNHAFEFAGAKGARFLDQLHKELHPKVRLELDIFWATIGGDKPEEVLAKWKGRVKSIHLKDAAPNPPVGASETGVPPEAFRELGKGILNLPSILRAAQKAGVEHYLIELDFSPGDPIESVRNGYQYLQSL